MIGRGAPPFPASVRSAATPEAPPPDHVCALHHAFRRLGGFAPGAEFLDCGSALGAGLACTRWPRLRPVPIRAPGSMASRGRKRKAEAALAAAAEKREKPAGGQEGEVEGPSVVIEHW